MAKLSRSVSLPALLSRARSIAIIAPHPDDELFGCGLLIGAARRANVKIAVIVLTDGQASHPNSIRWSASRLTHLRRSETRRGLARLGAANASLRFMGWKDGQLASTGCALRLRAALIECGATVVLVTSPRDFHADHRTAFRLAKQATRGVSMRLLTYEVWSRVGKRAQPARDIGITSKRWAAEAHRSQLGGYIVDDPSAFAFDATALSALVYGEERYETAL